MNQDQIKSEREKIEEEIADIKYQLDIARGRLKALQNRCKHPDMKSGCCMGESCSYCTDCGYES